MEYGVHEAFREEKEEVLNELLCGSDVGTMWGKRLMRWSEE